MRTTLIWSTVLLCCVGPLAQAVGSPASATEYRLIDRCDYQDSKAAGAVWHSINSSTRPLAAKAGGRQALTIQCIFKGSKAACASVERKVRLDLTGSQGVQFRFRCTDPASISKFNFYLHSGRGWYAASFATDSPSGWNTVIIDKGVLQKEGSPGGLEGIDRIRISAWKAGDTDTEFSICDLGLWGEDAPVLVVRGDWYVRKNPEEAASVTARIATLTQNLRAIGVEYNECSDLELNSERLRGRRLVILPQNAEIPEAGLKALETFLRAGGKMISFYLLPGELQAVAGISQGEYIRQSYTGAFASIRSTGKEISGLPGCVDQRSWGIMQAKPAGSGSRVAAYWHNDRGSNTGEPAIIVSDNCIHMTHVLLSDDPAGKRALMLAITGHFLPETWRRAAKTAIDQIGIFGPYQETGTFEQALSLRGKGDTGISRALDQGRQFCDKAEALFGLTRFVEALGAAEEAQKNMIRAYCMAQAPREGERRFAWCHDPFGVTGMDWDQSVGILADNGFTDIIVNMCWAGTAYYDSTVLPVASEATTRGDQIKQCLAACRAHGIKMHVWRVCWNLGWTAPKDFILKMKHDNRLQVDLDGNAKDSWLCPSDPDNQKLEIAAMTEIAGKYAVDGIHFDYIRYPSSTSCFCQGCRKRFEAFVQKKIRRWPQDVRADSSLWKRWLDFRRANINSVVAAASQNARAVRPGIAVSAAVFSNWPTDRDDVGQDWKFWCEAGYVDFICPMDYTSSERDFQTIVERQLAWAGKTPCYPGIGLSMWQQPDRISRLVEQVNITRRLGTGGFTIFNFNVSEARDILPLCGLGLTRKIPGAR